MTYRRRRKGETGAFLLTSLFIMALFLTTPLPAQYAITRSVLDMTGGESSSASYRLHGSCGQTTADISASAGYMLKTGFLAFGLEAVGINDPEGSSPLPRTYALTQNYPNPFNPSTTIKLDIPEKAGGDVHVRLDIYNIRGRLVRTLVDEERAPGSYTVQWDGRTDFGEYAGSGVYLYRVTAGEFTAIRKMVMVK